MTIGANGGEFGGELKGKKEAYMGNNNGSQDSYDGSNGLMRGIKTKGLRRVISPELIDSGIDDISRKAIVEKEDGLVYDFTRI